MHYLDVETEGINENGEQKFYKLNDFLGNKVVVYFYPEDDTPVCTKEAEEFRDIIDELNNFAILIGVSNSSIEEHLAFQNKHKLNFIILSDKDNELKNKFKEHLKESSDIHRSTFVLNENGEIIKAWEKVDVDEHSKEILEFLKSHS